MEEWHDFFVAQLGAAAALAGLLFVSLSVNQPRILQYSSLPERGIQALSSLFLVFTLSSVALAPHETPRMFGMPAFGLTALQIVILTWLQVGAYYATEKSYRRSSVGSFLVGQAASWAFLIGAALLIVQNDWAGLGWFVPGAILAFGFAGATAWVLLIEINR